MKATRKKSGFENFQKSGVQNSHGTQATFSRKSTNLF